MSLARKALLRASRSRWLADHVVNRAFAKRAAKRFMPGEELSDAVAAARTLATQNVGVILSRLGEALTGETQADFVRDHYLGALEQIRQEKLPAVISVKPTQLGVDASFNTCLEHLTALAAKATECNSQLWIDMEGSAYVDRTIDLYMRIKAQYAPVGIAIQAYLHRTPSDVERLMTVKPMIRVVKGAYAEPADVAFPLKADTDRQFVTICERLLDSATRGEATPVFGTHDQTILKHLIGRAQALNLRPDQYEIHTLFGIGMAEQVRRASEGHRVRCMINYGTQWFPWYMRRLAERPANVWFVVRSLFRV